MATPFIDCVWASGSMLLDAWTGGAVRISHRDLRAASGDSGPSDTRDLARGVAFATGMTLQFSPDGGDPVTFLDLERRLAAGGGAVVFGDYSALGAPFTRFDPGFAAQGVGGSSHAMYLDAYDPLLDEFWLMDPLGYGTYAGEWAPAAAISAFAWTHKGYLVAAVTPEPVAANPTAAAPSVPSFTFGQARVKTSVASGGSLDVTLPLAGHVWPGTTEPLAIRVTWTKGGVATTTTIVPASTSAGFRFMATAPTKSGRYTVRLLVIEPDGTDLRLSSFRSPAALVVDVGPN